MTDLTIHAFAVGYRYTCESTFMRSAQQYFERGNRGIYGEPINTSSPEGEINHFVDTVFDTSSSNFYLGFNKGELQYTYLLFEPSQSLDTVLSQIPVSNNWVRYTSANELQMDIRADAFSGGGIYNAGIYVFGGGHNNGMSDAVGYLDLRQFSTLGWTEPFASTADYLSVADDSYLAIGNELNTSYTDNGLFSRGNLMGRLSVHSYDGIVPVSDGFYLFGGEESYDNPEQPAPAWPNRHGAISFFNGTDWSHVSTGLSIVDAGRTAAVLNADDTNIIYVISDWELFEYNRTTNQFNLLSATPVWNTEGWIEYCNGEIVTGGGINNNLFTFGSLPFENSQTGSVTCANNQLYAYEKGTMWRWNNSWEVVATGGPTDLTYTYGRFGYDKAHGIFYMVVVTNNEWQTWFVKLN